MIQLTDSMILQAFSQWLWPFFRILGLLMTAPIFGTRTVPAPVRIVLGALLAALLAPMLPIVVDVDPLSLPGALTAAQQVVIGAALGLAVRMIFLVFEVAGQLIAQQMGLGFASMVDPQSGTSVPVVSQFYVVMATLLFLVFNGHLMLIQTLAISFDKLPVDAGLFPRGGMFSFFDWMGYLLGEALKLALPVVAALLVVNVGFGVMSRSAPQLNIFVVGFPLMMLGGMLAMIAVLGKLPTNFERMLFDTFQFVDALLTVR